MKPKSRKILVAVPEPLLKKLDASARVQQRTRTAELCIRLQASLKSKRPGTEGALA